MQNPRIIFAGTPEFAVASLEALVAAGDVPVAVLTQPDRPAGRGKQLAASPVKRFAQQHGIPLLQPRTLRDENAAGELRSLEPDLLVVAAYGLILPQDILDIPVHGCLNVHASLLPRWRGAAPIQAAIRAGDGQTGVCLMAMTAGLDCGPVYDCRKLDIGATETAGELHDRLAAAGGDLLAERLHDVLDGRLTAIEQEEDLASYAPKIVSAHAQLDWTAPATGLARVVRAYNPVPGAWFMVGDERIKCWHAEVLEAGGAPPGTVLDAGSDGIVVACGEAALNMTLLQRPGRRRVTAGELAAQLELTGRRL